MTDNQSFIDPLRLGVGQPDETTVLYGDQTWRVPDAGGSGITALTVTERAGSSTSVGAATNASATATCNAGEISIGGGFTTAGNQVLENGSDRNGTTGWTARVRNSQGSAQNFTPFVICLEIT